MKSLFCALFVLLCVPYSKQAETFVIYYEPDSSGVYFGVKQIKQSLEANSHTSKMVALEDSSPIQHKGMTIVVATREYIQKNASNLLPDGLPTSLKKEAYSFRKLGDKHLIIVGDDATGAMYGSLDFVDKFKNDANFASIHNTDKAPFIQNRGLKFNIPLDARTPSYSDNNVVVQYNLENMWDMDFWQDYLDEMALNRLNLLTLWNLSPFPSMVKVPEYPEIGLDDVMKTTLAVTEFGRSSSGKENVTPEVLNNLVKVKSITLDEKIKFWQDLMQYADDRGIGIMIYTWNIFVFGTQDSPYGITADVNNETTKDYLRKATAALIKTYPLLKGIGVTAGENMSHDHQKDEEFLFQSYGLGVNDALKDEPNREFVVAHRLGDVEVAKDAFKGLTPQADFSFCYKYSKAHAYTSTDPYWIHSHQFLEKIGPETPYFITIRDDSYYYLRGGSDPDFIREYINNIPNTDSNFSGFQLGPDGTLWAEEYVSLQPDDKRQLMLEKRWYHLRMWGKLAYDPSIDNSEFENLLSARFPMVDAKQLFKAWSAASKVVPLTNRFHNYKAYLDYQWNPELSISRPGYNSTSGFHDMDTFIRIQTQRDEGLIGIPDFVSGKTNGKGPFEVANELHALYTNAMSALNELNKTSTSDEELHSTLLDIEAMAMLGAYYSHKISAATNKALFLHTNDRKYEAAMIEDLQHTSHFWWEYSHLVRKQYKPMFYSRLRQEVDVLNIQAFVDNEVLSWGGKIPPRKRH